MQSAAAEAVDLTKESEATRNMYGMDDESTSVYGTNCLMARRLVERGVRFVELYCGSGSWLVMRTTILKRITERCVLALPTNQCGSCWQI